MTQTAKPFRVVVGTDFTEYSTAAFAEAARVVANRPSAELHLIHVIYEYDASQGTRLAIDAEKLDDAINRIRDWAYVCARQIEVEGPLNVVCHVRLGDPAEVVNQLAVDVDADLIVVGTSGLRGLERFLLGSTAEAVLKRAHCPVLVARRKSYEGLPQTPRVDPPRPGADIHRERDDMRWSSEIVQLGHSGPPAPPHIAGLV